jgi:YbgC/YbaW family acyl-CoA thioester hydrolase
MFEYQITVRGYELDSYGHVNHAVYLNYMEQARWEIIREAGLLDQLIREGKKLVVIKADVRYISEIKLFDNVIIHTKVKKEDPYLVFYQKFFNQNGNTRVARAVIKAILIDDQKKPLDISNEMILHIEQKQEGNG